MRLMTWNCHGMDSGKQSKLATYLATNKVDMAILQEGDSGFHNAESEQAGTGVFSTLVFDRSSTALELVAAASSSEFGLAPASGVSRAGYYNITGSLAFTKATDVGSVDYLANDEIKKWILVPAQACVDGKRINGKKLSVRRGNLEGGGDKNFKAQVEENMLKPVQRRLNMLGHRRPKAVDVSYNSTTLRIYYWHAPLGQDTKLDNVGFGSYSSLAGEGCGGELAVAASIRFSKHLGISADFPGNTLLVGDLNIKSDAVKSIYKTDNVLSSADGWCHAIAGSMLPLTAEVTNLSTLAGALGDSDHSPIVFTLP